jgi:hypothetical protein
MDFFFEWPLLYSLSSFIIIAIISSLLIYFIAHRAIKSHLKKPHERVGRVLFRTTASLLALLLSLSFANQRVNYYKIKDALESEASSLVDIWLDLQLYNTSETLALQQKVKHYIRSILHEEIDYNGENPLFGPPLGIFIMLYNQISELEPETSKQELLKQNLLTDIDEVSDFMQVRNYRSRPEPLILIYIATFGFIVSSILFSVYRPDRISISFFTLYNVFVAIVLYFIIMMNNPLIGPLKIQNEPFRMIIDIASMN